MSKAELLSSLPDLSQLEDKINNFNKDERRLLEERLQLAFKSFDSRLVQFRKDSDIDQFKTILVKKADGETV